MSEDAVSGTPPCETCGAQYPWHYAACRHNIVFNPYVLDADGRDYSGNYRGSSDAAGHLLQAIFGAPEHRDGPPFTHTLKLPETEEEMAAEPPPSFTLEDGS